MNPKYPIYIPSKGRAETRLTMKSLDKIGVDYHVIVELDDYENYAALIDKSKILVLDMSYKENYDACDDLGNTRNKGSGAARNFGGDHSRANGHDRHWIMDDNIRWFYRLNRNMKYTIQDGTMFKVMEDFVDRYENIAMAGPQYSNFAHTKYAHPPFHLNTRIYSCNLIRNDLPYRWRGRFNEDTDLSLRMLKDGFCTILFNAFIQEKMATQRMKGGNTDTVYVDGTILKSSMIERLHPDVCRMSVRFGRVHHYVDYRKFKHNKLRLKPNLDLTEQVNNYGMKLFQERENETNNSLQV